jgi:septation ring formation regulator EzrA
MNKDYEKGCVNRALSPYGKHEVSEIDLKIAVYEQDIANLQERRREVINRYSHNKPCVDNVNQQYESLGGK